jgi:hypothetical protein
MCSTTSNASTKILSNWLKRTTSPNSQALRNRSGRSLHFQTGSRKFSRFCLSISTQQGDRRATAPNTALSCQPAICEQVTLGTRCRGQPNQSAA